MTEQKDMYSKYISILQLLQRMQTSIEGVSYNDVRREFQCSRRTAERIIGAICKEFPNCRLIDKRRPKRWRISDTNSVLEISQKVNPDDLAALETAAKMFNSRGMMSYQERVERLYDGIKNHIGTGSDRTAAADAQSMGDSEAFVFNPGPIQVIDDKLEEKLRNAVHDYKKISFDYFKSGETTSKRYHRLHPYGFLHGRTNRQYLLAFNDTPNVNDFRTFILTNLENLRVHENEGFIPKKGFTVENYLKDCFGIFKENKVYEVVWIFNSDVADTVKRWNFHQSQKIRKLKDGRIKVRFWAGGLLEMAWHIVTWGSQVEVIEPPELIKTLREVKNSIRLPEE